METRKTDAASRLRTYYQNQLPRVFQQTLISEILLFKNKIESKSVEPQNIHLIASSGAAYFSNLDILGAALAEEDLKIVPISASEEANLALKASVPSEFASEAFLVDIGSGNTTFSWTDGVDTTTRESFGSKYYLNSTPDSLVFRKMRDIVLDIPDKNRNLCFLIGGIPYQFAAFTNKRQERYTILQSPNSYPKDNNNWIAGGVIFRAIFLEPTYSYIFVWDSNFVIGYLMTVN